MNKIWVKIIIYVVLILGILTTSILYINSNRHIKTLKNQVKEQSVIIDSLLKRRMVVFDVELNVTDKSKSIIHGRYNKGTISMPQEKTYKLIIDSTNIKVNQ